MRTPRWLAPLLGCVCVGCNAIVAPQSAPEGDHDAASDDALVDAVASEPEAPIVTIVADAPAPRDARVDVDRHAGADAVTEARCPAQSDPCFRAFVAELKSVATCLHQVDTCATGEGTSGCGIDDELKQTCTWPDGAIFQYGYGLNVLTNAANDTCLRTEFSSMHGRYAGSDRFPDGTVFGVWYDGHTRMSGFECPDGRGIALTEEAVRSCMVGGFCCRRAGMPGGCFSAW